MAAKKRLSKSLTTEEANGSEFITLQRQPFNKSMLTTYTDSWEVDRLFILSYSSCIDLIFII